MKRLTRIKVGRKKGQLLSIGPKNVYKYRRVCLRQCGDHALRNLATDDCEKNNIGNERGTDKPLVVFFC